MYTVRMKRAANIYIILRAMTINFLSHDATILDENEIRIARHSFSHLFIIHCSCKNYHKKSRTACIIR
jgi:hypothetical protein